MKTLDEVNVLFINITHEIPDVTAQRSSIGIVASKDKVKSHCFGAAITNIKLLSGAIFFVENKSSYFISTRTYIIIYLLQLSTLFLPLYFSSMFPSFLHILGGKYFSCLRCGGQISISLNFTFWLLFHFPNLMEIGISLFLSIFVFFTKCILFFFLTSGTSLLPTSSYVLPNLFQDSPNCSFCNTICLLLLFYIYRYLSV